MSMLSTSFVLRFNSAADAFERGDFNLALEKYRSIFSSDVSESENISAQFFMEVRLRTAFCLIELQDFPEARFELEDPKILALLVESGPAQHQAYLFSYANVLSQLGEAQAADLNYEQAYTIAHLQLKDITTAERTLMFRLQNAQRFGDWKNLLHLAREGAGFAKENFLPQLAHTSREAACLAYRGLLRFEDARKGAEIVLHELQKSGAPSTQTAKWTRFISELNRPAAA